MLLWLGSMISVWASPADPQPEITPDESVYQDSNGPSECPPSITSERSNRRFVRVDIVEDRIDIWGTYPQDTLIERIEEDLLRRYRYCYERGVVRDNEAHTGQLSIEFHVSNDGTLSDIRTEHSTLNTSTNQCIRIITGQLELPPNPNANTDLGTTFSIGLSLSFTRA